MRRLAVTLGLLITVQVRRPLMHRSREWLFETSHLLIQATGGALSPRQG
ncbi:hypothetical protein [Streptomyces antibioticus]|nr:hypothetical protein [Streptomyces sp. S9]